MRNYLSRRLPEQKLRTKFLKKKQKDFQLYTQFSFQIKINLISSRKLDKKQGKWDFRFDQISKRIKKPKKKILKTCETDFFFEIPIWEYDFSGTVFSNLPKFQLKMQGKNFF